jgi:hypothetical protein
MLWSGMGRSLRLLVLSLVFVGACADDASGTGEENGGSERCTLVDDLADPSGLDESCQLPMLAQDATRTYASMPAPADGCPDWCEGGTVEGLFQDEATENAEACDGTVESIDLLCGREWTSGEGETLCMYVADYVTSC